MDYGQIEAWVQTSLGKNGYDVKYLIGTGAFGKVYLVKNRQTGIFFACKSASTLQSQKLLRKEAELLQQIRHPVFPLFESFREERTGCFLLMEYVEGESLTRKLEKGALPVKQAVDYAVRLAEGLRYLHELSEPVLYRDLKPEHVKVSPGGGVKLLDLGCACRLSEVRFSKAGTKGYAPLEQLVDGLPGIYSDVYALGKLLYYMLTGDNPCLISAQGSVGKMGYKQLTPYLQKFIEQCIEEDYRERIQDMNCILRNLQNCNYKEGFLYEKIEI